MKLRRQRALVTNEMRVRAAGDTYLLDFHVAEKIRLAKTVRELLSVGQPPSHQLRHQFQFWTAPSTLHSKEAVLFL